MTIRKKSRGLIYLRRSGTKQETSLQKQLEWALAEAKQHGVSVDASVEDVHHMQAKGLFSYKSIRLDDAVTGAELARKGLGALVADVENDATLSHIFVFKRNRLGRPDSPLDLMVIEAGILRQGATIVRSDGVANPAPGGELQIADYMGMLIDYHKSREDLRELAVQMIHTQLQLTRGGFWAGGSAPFGFARVLVNAKGDILEVLPKGKRVRQDGCHVVIIPQDMEKIRIWLRILVLKERGWGYKRIATYLTRKGIPSPGAGTVRTDHGVKHEVSGKWNHTTVRDLCKNRAILGLLDYGRRSEGRIRRLGKDGPRVLEESDRNRLAEPRRITNDPSLVVTGDLPGEALFDADRWQDIQDETRNRARNQVGLPRARDYAKSPLSCRLIDLTDNCNSTMYSRPSGKRRLYVCGRYTKSGGAECNNNAVDAEAALKFTLDMLLELVDRLGSHDKLRERLMERARNVSANQRTDESITEKRQLESRVADLERQLGVAQRNYAIEENAKLREGIRAEYLRIDDELEDAREELEQATTTAERAVAKSPEDNVDSAMALLENIRRVAQDPSARADTPLILERLGLRIGLQFTEGIKGKKRRVRRLIGGVMAFGDRLLPYRGLVHGGSNPGGTASPDDEERDAHQGIQESPRRSSRGTGKGRSRKKTAPEGNAVPTEAIRPTKGPREGVSFTKGSRGDWI